MAFLHFTIESNPAAKCEYYLDGSWHVARNEEYIEIPNGRHVINFESETTRWNIQEKIGDDECVEIIVVLDVWGRLLGKPEYGVVSLSEAEVNGIRENIQKTREKIREIEAKKAKSTYGMILILMGLCGIVMGGLEVFYLKQLPTAVALIIPLVGVLFMVGGIKLKRK